MKSRLLIPILLSANIAFAQQHSNLNIRIGNEWNIFIKKVKIYNTQNDREITLKDGKYMFEDSLQSANIIISKGLISGDVTEIKKYPKGEYSEGSILQSHYNIKNSFVTEFIQYADSLLFLKAHRDQNKAYYKEYRKDQTLKEESWTSLDKNKHHLSGISKSYFKDGTVARITNDVSGVITEFYANGNPKSKMGRNIYESFNGDGTLEYKAYTKNNIRYNDYYTRGKLTSRTYENSEKNEVKEYYENAVLLKREVAKTINGEKRLLTYDKSGSLISNESCSVQAVGPPKMIAPGAIIK